MPSRRAPRPARGRSRRCGRCRRDAVFVDLDLRRARSESREPGSKSEPGSKRGAPNQVRRGSAEPGSKQQRTWFEIPDAGRRSGARARSARARRVSRAELAHDVGAVGLGGPHRDEQPLGDLLVRVPECEQAAAPRPRARRADSPRPRPAASCRRRSCVRRATGLTYVAPRGDVRGSPRRARCRPPPSARSPLAPAANAPRT